MNLGAIDMGAMDIKVILSLLAIMTAAAVALILDYRRTRVLRLREEMVEMRVREVEVSRVQPKRKPAAESKTTPSPAARAIRRAVATPAPPPEPAPPPPTQVAPVEPLAPEHPGLEFVPPPRARRPAPEPLLEPEARESSKEALSSWLIQRAIARAAEMAKADERIEPTGDHPALESPQNPVPENSTPAASFQPVVVDESLWHSLFAQRTDPEDPILPNGLQPKSVVSRLPLEAPFTGLVAAIGIAPASSAAVKAFLVRSSAPSDFVCRSADDEFLLICPNVSGAESQRRLGDLSTGLWGLSSNFSLGGVDVQDESLGYAISAAKERMLQSRLGRRANAMAD